VPYALNGESMPLQDIVRTLNQWYRHASWGWEMVIENRATGIKSRGIYINPAAKVLHMAVDALARTTFNKPTYDRYVALGADYGGLLYRGEYYSDQRLVVEAAAQAILKPLTGSVTVNLEAQPYAARILAEKPLFCQATATFEASDYSHADAAGFISLSWLSLIGRPFVEEAHADTLETGHGTTPGVCQDKQVA
jgi:argininosuccinate synthase